MEYNVEEFVYVGRSVKLFLISLRSYCSVSPSWPVPGFSSLETSSINGKRENYASLILISQVQKQS